MLGKQESAHFHTLDCHCAEVGFLHCCHPLSSSRHHFTRKPQKPVCVCYTKSKIPKWNLAMLSKHFPVLISNVIEYIN